MVVAAVIGAGPAGLAVVAKLIDLGVTEIKWIDPEFTGGRFKLFRHVPSNTKVSLFVKFFDTFKSLSSAIQSYDPAFRSLEALRTHDPNKGCCLSLVSGVLEHSINALAAKYNISMYTDICTKLEKSGNQWSLFLKNIMIKSDAVYLCTGSQPVDENLEKCLNFQINALSKRISVIAASHSGVLAAKFLIDSGAQQVQIISRPGYPRFAEYLKNGEIKFDNTGLKGDAAKFAKNISSATEPVSIVCPYTFDEYKDISKRGEIQKKILQEFNPDLVIQATGYERSPLPVIICEEMICKDISYDNQGRLTSNGIVIPGLSGFGIAFPELVSENDEATKNVGMWKFLKHIDASLEIPPKTHF